MGDKVKKRVGAYELDITNGGLAGYFPGGCAFSGVKAIPPLSSPSEFFGGEMLEGEPDAVVVDLPGDPLKRLGNDMSMDDLICMMFGVRDFGFEPVMLYPLTNKAVSAESLRFALGAFPCRAFGVFKNEWDVPRAQLEAGSAFPAYGELAEDVAFRGGMEFDFPAMGGATLTHAVDVLKMPFGLGFPVSEDGEPVSQREILDALTGFLGPRGVSKADARGAYLNLKQFLASALPGIEGFVGHVMSAMEADGSVPALMVYSGKGGEGKSFIMRMVLEYLRRYWANGLLYSDAPIK